MSKLEKLGALWLNTSGKGVKYMTGKIGEQRIVVFKVKEKRSDKHPDYEIFKSEPRGQRQEEEPAGDF